MRLCIACRHFTAPASRFDDPRCARAVYQDPVSGITRLRHCDMERVLGCGPDGKHFEAAEIARVA